LPSSPAGSALNCFSGLRQEKRVSEEGNEFQKNPIKKSFRRRRTERGFVGHFKKNRKFDFDRIAHLLEHH
jgi:hypothetical protein